MACGVCDRTPQGLGDRYFWCPCCGTLKRVTVSAAAADEIDKPAALDALLDCAKAVEAYNAMMDAQEAGGVLSEEGFKQWSVAQKAMLDAAKFALSYFRPVFGPSPLAQAYGPWKAGQEKPHG